MTWPDPGLATGYPSLLLFLGPRYCWLGGFFRICRMIVSHCQVREGKMVIFADGAMLRQGAKKVSD